MTVGAIRLGFVSILVVTAVVVVGASTSWRPSSDVGLMMYIGRMVAEFGRVPYVAIWDLHPPGAFAAYIAAGSVFGYSFQGARMADLAVMAVMLGATWRWMRRHGRLPAIAGVACLALLHSRPQFMLQRETIAFAPILIAIVTLTSGWPRPTWQVYLAGAAFGLASTIKPGMIVGLPVVALWIWRSASIDTPEGFSLAAGPQRARARWQTLAWLAAGAASPAGLALAYLVTTGSLQAFVEMTVNYWPAYAMLDGSVWAAGSPIEMANAMLVEYLRAPQMRWIPVAAVGIWFAWRATDRADQQRLVLFCAVAAAQVLYVGVHGHFAWSHWVPFLYLIVPLSCLVLVDHQEHRSRLAQATALGLLIVVVGRYAPIPDELVSQLIRGHSLDDTQLEQQRVAEALVAKGGRSVRVQSFGWIWADSMLIAGSAPATAIVHDGPFLPSEPTPYLNRIRRDFLREFDANPPDVLLFPRLPRTSQPPRPDVTVEEMNQRLHNYRAFDQTEHIVMFERVH